MYSLTSDDGRGDSGGMSMAIWKDVDNDGLESIRTEHDARPRVGVVMRVGSMTARSYQYQDWWQCTEIQEIVEEHENLVRFRTRNSMYTWEARV